MDYVKLHMKFDCLKSYVNLLNQKLEKGSWDWGCGFFLWEDEIRRCSCGDGMCALVRYNKEDVEVCSLQVCKMLFYCPFFFPKEYILNYYCLSGTIGLFTSW
jgi:hypothetical protein